VHRHPNDGPSVSILLPVGHGERHLAITLRALAAQTYPQERMEIVAIAHRSAGPSRDIVTAFAAARPHIRLRLLETQAGSPQTAFHRGIRAATGDILVRMDGDTIPDLDYVTTCVAALQRSGAAMVGGCIHPFGDTPFARAVAVAQSSPFGVADTTVAHADRPGFVDRVHLGAIHRAALETLDHPEGPCLSDEGEDLALRLRTAGHRVYLDPEIRSRYAPRATPLELMEQHATHGWRTVARLRQHPAALRWPQATPPLYAAALLLALALTPFSAWGWRATLLLMSAYAIAHLIAGRALRRAGRFRASAGDPATSQGWTHVALTLAHVAYASGFLANLLTLGRLPRRSARRAAHPAPAQRLPDGQV
jgi:succinoglycan biosynthesis protein ExoA